MEIGWQNSPANGMAGATTMSQPNPNAPGTNPQGPAGTYPPPPGAAATPGTNPAATTTPPGPPQYYQPPAQTDPRYIHADPHWTPQQRAAYELAINSGPAGHDAAAQLGAANWADWDHRRAGYAADEAARRLAWKASLTPSTQTGVDAPVYNPDDDTFSIVDKDGKWTHGLAAKDVYSHLADTVQKQYPEWYFGQYATQQQQNKRSNLDAQAFTNEGFARMGQQSTRYAASSL